MNDVGFNYYVGYTNGRCVKKFRSLRAAQYYLHSYVKVIDLHIFGAADYPFYNPA